ncbi:tripartite tricarboxylate transporter substrate binding protein [Variovorax sp. RKNM96]|uniref:tripartite tricarboxylate transporter substrate-binding protein n=1 Tax=Variovorax sp. RKNM96 TaxID=2681552 RepID=UPI00197DED9A|nr:tripartite tricarboxylate transporter substrate-binding protein [Variovorax sp. RKNM96]QSI31807.1 tripartite tricarboxylate transporter substrate binding protein [Variovorax sp. RKNM96]
MSGATSVTRRAMLAAMAAAGLCGRDALAANGTTRALRMIVPQAPGGAADFMARLLAKDLSGTLERPVFVDNRPGGGMIIGTQAVATAAPDGNTFGIVFSPHAVNQAMRQHMPYNALTDFKPICLGGHSIVVLVAQADFAARSVAQVIELAQRTDPPLQYASLGIGSVSHLAGELLSIEADVELEHVPYNGSSQVYRALIGGDLPLAFVTLESALPHLRARRIRALGITSARRVAAYPQLPAIAESLPGFELVGFYGFVAPARTPSRFVDTLSTEIAKTLQTPHIRDRLASDGVVVSVEPPEVFAEFLRQQIDKYAALARRTGIRLD